MHDEQHEQHPGTSDASCYAMNRGSWTLFHVRGVPIRAHWTLLLIIPYLAFALTLQFRALATYAGVQPHLHVPAPIWGLVLAIALFASVALHELGHTFVATRFGGRVRSITLMLVGGVSQLARAPSRPREEALMALAGPAVSLALGASFFILQSFVRSADATVAMFYLGAMNLMLGIFNLVPAFPMDGGRVLRAALTTRMGRARATQVAAAVGKACAIGFGIFAILTASFLLGIIALFVYAGASGELAAQETHDVLEGRHIADLLPANRPPPLISADANLGEALRRMRELDRLELVVIDRTGAPLGVIAAADLRGLAGHPELGRDLRAVLAATTTRYTRVAPEADASQAIEAAAGEGARYLVVGDPACDAVLGIVGPEDIARAIALGHDVGGHPPHAAHPVAT